MTGREEERRGERVVVGRRPDVVSRGREGKGEHEGRMMDESCPCRRAETEEKNGREAREDRGRSSSGFRVADESNLRPRESTEFYE